MRYVVDEGAWKGYVSQVKEKDVLSTFPDGKRNLKDIIKSTHNLLESVCNEQDDKRMIETARVIESSLRTLQQRTGVIATMGNFLKLKEEKPDEDKDIR